MAVVASRMSSGRSAKRGAVQRNHAAHSDHVRQTQPDDKPLNSVTMLGNNGLRGRGNAPVQIALMQEMQQTYGNRAVQRFLQRIKTVPHTASVSVQRDDSKKRASKVKPPPLPKFTLSGLNFKVDGATIKATGKDGGWKFTPVAAATSGPTAATPTGGSSTPTTPVPTTTPTPTPTPTTPAAPTAPAEFDATRTMPDSEYLTAAGASSPLGERTKVKIAASKATVDAPVVLLPASGAPQLTITLDNNGRGSTKPVAVGTYSASALVVSLSGHTPKDGDAIKIPTNRGKELYVFSTLKPSAGTKVEGFFDIGNQTKYKGTVGVAGERRSEAFFDKTFDKLVAAGKVSTAIKAEKDIFAATSEIEGHFDTVQTYDTGVFTFGFGQWTANASLPAMLKSVPDDVYNLHLGQYGLGRGTPTLGNEQQMRKLAPPKELNKVYNSLDLRNASEGSMTLNGKEMISSKAYAFAKTWAAKHDQSSKDLTAFKADLAGADKAKAKQAEKKIDARWAELAGWSGIPKKPPRGASADQKADALIAGVTAAKAAADKVVSDAQSIEAIRTNEWVLRFQIFGQDPAVQVAQLQHTHDTLDDLKKKSTGTGVPYGTLLPSGRGQAVLISTWLNNPSSVHNGMKASVPEFKKAKVAEADKAAKDAAAKVTELTNAKAAADKIAGATKTKDAADRAKAQWEKFPWPASDANWTTHYTTAAAGQFLKIAEPKMLSRTTDPARRTGIMNKHFAPYKGIGKLPDNESARQSLGERVEAQEGAGSSLDASVQRRLGESLGADLSGVRVHTDGEADSLNRSIQATAFTSGQDIFFREGTYNPSSSEGMRLLAHEATHTVQQSQGPVSGTPAPGGVSISDPSDSFEKTAETAADRVVSGAQADLQPRGTVQRKHVQVQRQPAPPNDTITDTDAQGVTRTRKKAGWNKGEARFEKKGWTKAIIRHHIVGLTNGNIVDDKDEGEEWGGEGKVKSITDELASDPTAVTPTPSKSKADTPKRVGKAIVLVPNPLNAKSVDVMLYLHGFGIGYRERKVSRMESVKVNGKKKKVEVGGMEAGTVRDVGVDRMEEQLGTVNEANLNAKSRPMVAVMPQGRYTAQLGAQFGKNFNGDDYLNEIWGKVGTLASVTRGRVVLAGHSGASGTIATVLGNAVDNKGNLKSDAEMKKAGVPTNLAEVVLFDAINSSWHEKDGKKLSGQLQNIENWVEAQIKKDMRELTGKSDADQGAYLQKSMMRFRGYYSSGYSNYYEELKKANRSALDRELSRARGDKKNPLVLSAVHEKTLRDNYVESIQPLARGHEDLMGSEVVEENGKVRSKKDKDKDQTKVKGAVEHALGALPAVQPQRTVQAGTIGSDLVPRPNVVNGQSSGIPGPHLQRTPLSIQRDDPPGTTPVDPVKKQWDDDWNDDTFKQVRKYFDGSTRPNLSGKARYLHFCQLYKDKGVTTRPLPYLASMLPAPFYHYPNAKGHPSLVSALKTAETALKTKYPTAPVKQMPWALEVRTTSTGSWSNHAAGKAIDFDPDTNPHLDNAAHRKVISTLTGLDMEKDNPGESMSLDSYDALKLASDRFKASYNEAGMTKRIEELKPAEEKLTKERDELTKKASDLAKSKEQIKKDRDAVLKDKKASNDMRKEAKEKAKTVIAEIDKQSTEIKAQLTKKNTEVKGAQDPIKTLEDELKRYKAEQKRYDASVKGVETAEGEVTGPSEQVTTLSAEKAALEADRDLAKEQVEQAEDVVKKAKKEKKAELPDLKKALQAKNAELAKAKKALSTKQSALTKANALLKKKRNALEKKKEGQDAFTLRKYGRQGILNLPKDLVKAMKDAGFKWGGDGATTYKDIMHFQVS